MKCVCIKDYGSEPKKKYFNQGAMYEFKEKGHLIRLEKSNYGEEYLLCREFFEEHFLPIVPKKKVLTAEEAIEKIKQSMRLHQWMPSNELYAEIAAVLIDYQK